jgi:hypothetical protein
MFIMLCVVCGLIFWANNRRYHHELQLRYPHALPALFERKPKSIPNDAVVTSVVAEPVNGDGRIGSEGQLRTLPAPERTQDPRISTSEELLERLQADGLRVIIPHDRVRELRKARNGGKPRADMLDPVIDAEYSIVEEALAPELAVETVIEPWEHDLAAMAS